MPGAFSCSFLRHDCLYCGSFESVACQHSMRMINDEYGFLREKEDELMKEFYARAKQNGLRAKIIMVDRREPYVFHAGKVCVTLDGEIKDSTDVKRFFDPCIPLLPFTISSQISRDNPRRKNAGRRATASRKEIAFSRPR